MDRLERVAIELAVEAQQRISGAELYVADYQIRHNKFVKYLDNCTVYYGQCDGSRLYRCVAVVFEEK